MTCKLMHRLASNLCVQFDFCFPLPNTISHSLSLGSLLWKQLKARNKYQNVVPTNLVSASNMLAYHSRIKIFAEFFGTMREWLL